MQNRSDFLKYLKQPNILFLSLISVLGIIVFGLNIHNIFYSEPDWMLIMASVFSLLMLKHYIFQLPPEGNTLSMYSVIYLALIFEYGLGLTIMVLFLSDSIYSLYYWKKPWNRHLANFSIAMITVVSAYYAFSLSGGKAGELVTQHPFPFIITLFTYFSVNMLLFSFNFFLTSKQSMLHIMKGLLNETIAAFISFLVLSIMLANLLESFHSFALLIFLLYSVLLSIAFRQHFTHYTIASEQAIRDQRTGLYNHGYFEDQLENFMKVTRKHHQALSLALIDIDDFKKYNDTYGHLKGDQLLAFFSSCMEKELEMDGILVARYGGEEFAILFSNKSNHEAFVIIEQLRKKINNSRFEGMEVFPYGCISFSAGIAGYEKGMNDKSQIVDRADQAMYYAKAQGKNVVHIYDEEASMQREINVDKEIREMDKILKLFLTKDAYSYQHSKRVFQYAVEMGELLQLDESEKKTLMLGALYHDIGKLEVPKQILSKQGKYTTEEWEIVKSHVIWGKEIAATTHTYRELIPLIELHHERYDGNGYPHGIIGEDIPKLVRILTIIDSFDAMTTDRPYQKTKTMEEAIEELQCCAGKQFDPDYIHPFIELIMKKEKWKNRYQVN